MRRKLSFEERQILKRLISEKKKEQIMEVRKRMKVRSHTCSGCGCYVTMWTSGCKACSDRHRKWRSGKIPYPFAVFETDQYKELQYTLPLVYEAVAKREEKRRKAKESH
jgi:7-cyano-7-deazaguanine synthase in queuosine biosynthesis